MHAFQRLEMFFGEAKHLLPFSSVQELRCFCSFFFFWAGTVLSSTTFSFPLKQWSVSCHWLHSRSSVRDSMSSSWDWTLFCHTSNKRLYFPVPASEKIHRVSWSSSSVMQITTSVVSSSGDKCYVKPGFMHPPAVCLNGFVSAVTVSVCAGK